MLFLCDLIIKICLKVANDNIGKGGEKGTK